MFNWINQVVHFNFTQSVFRLGNRSYNYKVTLIIWTKSDQAKSMNCQQNVLNKSLKFKNSLIKAAMTTESVACTILSENSNVKKSVSLTALILNWTSCSDMGKSFPSLTSKNYCHFFITQSISSWHITILKGIKVIIPDCQVVMATNHYLHMQKTKK